MDDKKRFGEEFDLLYGSMRGIEGHARDIFDLGNAFLATGNPTVAERLWQMAKDIRNLAEQGQNSADFVLRHKDKVIEVQKEALQDFVDTCRAAHSEAENDVEVAEIIAKDWQSLSETFTKAVKALEK